MGRVLPGNVRQPRPCGLRNYFEYFRRIVAYSMGFDAVRVVFMLDCKRGKNL